MARTEEFIISRYFEVLDGEIYCFIAYDSQFAEIPHWQERMFHVEQFPYPESSLSEVQATGA